ncbi:MAG: DUF2306 domain-containing protein [bacterium]
MTSKVANAVLTAAARFWFVVMWLGQWVFLYYIAAFYGSSVVQGHFQAWTRNSNLLKGYVAGDTAGNLAFAAHVLLAAVVAFGGTLQLVPQLRRAPYAVIHRWNGRLFLATAALASIAGLYMVWVRHTVTSLHGALAITIDAMLILAFSSLTWRAARGRAFTVHRRWALRTYLVANGVWFQRVGLLAWAISANAAGLPKSTNGTFYNFWEFGSYLFPLAVLELYLRVKDTAGPRARLATAGLLILLTLLMGLGIAGAWMFMWRPVLLRAS